MLDEDGKQVMLVEEITVAQLNKLMTLTGPEDAREGTEDPKVKVVKDEAGALQVL